MSTTQRPETPIDDSDEFTVLDASDGIDEKLVKLHKTIAEKSRYIAELEAKNAQLETESAEAKGELKRISLLEQKQRTTVLELTDQLISEQKCYTARIAELEAKLKQIIEERWSYIRVLENAIVKFEEDKKDNKEKQEKLEYENKLFNLFLTSSNTLMMQNGEPDNKDKSAIIQLHEVLSYIEEAPEKIRQKYYDELECKLSLKVFKILAKLGATLKKEFDNVRSERDELATKVTDLTDENHRLTKACHEKERDTELYKDKLKLVRDELDRCYGNIDRCNNTILEYCGMCARYRNDIAYYKNKYIAK